MVEKQNLQRHKRVDTLSGHVNDYWFVFSLCVNNPELLRLFSDVPEKQGLLFSDDELKMDVDADETSDLVAAAKITLFEVEILSRSLTHSLCCNSDT